MSYMFAVIPGCVVIMAVQRLEKNPMLCTLIGEGTVAFRAVQNKPYSIELFMEMEMPLAKCYFTVNGWFAGLSSAAVFLEYRSECKLT